MGCYTYKHQIKNVVIVDSTYHRLTAQPFSQVYFTKKNNVLFLRLLLCAPDIKSKFFYSEGALDILRAFTDFIMHHQI